MSSAERYAVDTSVALAALDAAHAAHQPCLDVVRLRRPGLAGHAAFEVYSVLTRMPGQLGVDPVDAGNLVHRVFPEIAWLAGDDGTRLRLRVATLGVTGGDVYDALVGEAARTHGLTLLSRDLRASRTYDPSRRPLGARRPVTPGTAHERMAEDPTAPAALEDT